MFNSLFPVFPFYTLHCLRAHKTRQYSLFIRFVCCEFREHPLKTHREITSTLIYYTVRSVINRCWGTPTPNAHLWNCFNHILFRSWPAGWKALRHELTVRFYSILFFSPQHAHILKPKLCYIVAQYALRVSPVKDTNGWLVRVGVSVTWNVLSWSGGHEFEPWVEVKLGMRSTSVQVVLEPKSSEGSNKNSRRSSNLKQKLTDNGLSTTETSKAISSNDDLQSAELKRIGHVVTCEQYWYLVEQRCFTIKKMLLASVSEKSLYPTQRTPDFIQLCLISHIGLWEQKLLHTIFLPMLSIQILLFGLRDSLVQRRRTVCQLGEDKEWEVCSVPLKISNREIVVIFSYWVSLC